MIARNALRARARAALCCLLAAASLALVPQGALSQQRQIKIINPYPPGGTADIIIRLLTEQIGRAQGVAFVIENRPGAGTVIGSDVASRAAPDGNTLLINTPALLINAHLRKLNFDSLASFEPICNMAQSPQLLMVNSTSPYKTMADFVAAARARPGELTLASTGPASPSQIGLENLKHASGLDIIYVPFPGNAPTVNALLGGHVTAGIANFADLTGHMQAGKLRALVTLTPSRVATLPGLPTVAEAGFKEFEYLIWFGLVAPAKTPPQTVKQLADWIAAARQAPEVKDKLGIQGLFPATECGADFAALMRHDYETYGRVIHDAGIKGE